MVLHTLNVFQIVHFPYNNIWMQWRWMEVWRNYSTFILPSNVGMRHICYFHESFVVMACVGRCQGLWYFPHLCYSTFLHCQMKSIFEKWSPRLYYQQWYLCFDHLKEPINLLFLVICFVIWGSSTFSCSYGTSNICLLDVLASHLLGNGPPFDFAIFCFKIFDAPFWHCLL